MSDARGRVALVGAGPGDPELITVRGANALREADVVLYDELACDDLLALAPPTALLVNVGKRGHDAPTRSQGDIDALLVEHARAGRRVVRLKGGDPFVFGRGGEEASACVAAGVPFEVVPGVPSATAALAYAGIPVTDRRHAASFAVVTGHKDPTRVSEETRWAELGRAVDTLVILMGMRNLAQIVAKLVAGGRAASTPAAAVMHGTLGLQRTVVAPLGELPAAVERAGLRAPSAVVVGDVVRLRDELAWWERAPLFGLRVLVTRARAQAGDVLHALRAAGAEPVVAPMIRVEPPEDARALDAALGALAAGGTYDAVVFTSANAVRFTALRARARGIALGGLAARVVCGGPVTARAALEAGLPVHLVPPADAGAGDADALLAAIERELAPRGRRFLLPRSQIGRDVLRDGLRAAGAAVDAVVAYRTLEPEPGAIDGGLAAQIGAGALAVVTFTSPSTVRHLLARVDAEGRAALGAGLVAAVGPTTADALRAEGLAPEVVPARPGGLALVDALVDHLRAHPARRDALRARQDEALARIAAVAAADAASGDANRGER
ncbi:MAG: uroporphyrinogen-III C-methyltransferase [Myxococcota bacterium]